MHANLSRRIDMFKEYISADSHVNMDLKEQYLNEYLDIRLKEKILFFFNINIIYFF